jgi:RNA polymerase sigma-70 factor, ECF subfamily
MFLRRFTHFEHVGTHVLATPAGLEGVDKPDFDSVYGRYFHLVASWIHALGGPDADVEDVAQEVFVVVGRKLERFDGKNIRAWLYTITARMVRDHRRRAWFRHVRTRDSLDELPRTGPDVVEQLAQAQARRLLYRLLDQMDERRRSVFVFYEIEGYKGEEIAELLEIPLATVWSRLKRARQEFVARVARLRQKENEP